MLLSSVFLILFHGCIGAVISRRSTLSTESLTVALVRVPPALWSEPILSRSYIGVDINATTERGVGLIQEAASRGAQLIAFPELWFPGYPRGNGPEWIPTWAANYVANSLVVGDSNWNKLVTAAKQNNIYVALAYSERADDAIYMAQALLDSQGEVIIHRHKLRPSGGERSIWSDGTINEMIVRNTSFGRIGLLECWEHFHPSMTFPMQAQLESIHIGAWPYTPNYGDKDALFWESAEVNMAAARLYAVNSGAYTLVPSVGRAAIFGPTGVELAYVDANTSYDSVPLLYHTINTTSFTNKPYNPDGEQSWDVLQQIVNGWPPETAKISGTFVQRKTNPISSFP